MRISDWSSDVCSSDLQLGNDARCDLVIEAGTVLGLPIFARTLAAGTAAGGFTHGFPPHHPKKHKASPKGGGGRRRATKRPGSSGRRHRQGGTKRSTPSEAKGLPPATTGLAGSAARTRRNGRGTSQAPAPSRGATRQPHRQDPR